MATQKSAVKMKNGAGSAKAVKKKSAGKPAKAARPSRAVSGKAAGPAIDAYTERRNAALRDVASAVRRLVKKTVPAAVEAINPWGIPVFELNGPFCLMMIGRNHVTLGFTRGTALNDPSRLLEGTGKNIRHVKLKTPEAAGHPDLRNLLLEAAALSGKPSMSSSMRPR